MRPFEAMESIASAETKTETPDPMRSEAASLSAIL